MLMNKESEQAVEPKGNYYRNRFRSTLGLLTLMILVCAGLSVILLFMNAAKEQPRYYATTTTGVVRPLAALSQPMVTQNFLLQWASLATRAAFNLSFVNYEDQLKKAKPFFTESGWAAFNKALKQAKVIETITDSKLVVSAVVSGPPVILNQDVIRGHYTWRVQLPLLLTYTSASETRKAKLLVTMNIMRVSTLETPAGIQINDFTAT